ncbi:MAG: hypothetical protein ABJ205_08280 [Erythrobacter sp.]|uniref:hypothetical protein n=1 Tax=Erythrobacter sp. TaxID=1042 RepID=UPI0032663DFD
MIDYFALALGHCLLVLAFMRLVMRDSLDIDPAITELKEAADAKRSVGKGNRRRQRGSSGPEKGSAAQ